MRNIGIELTRSQLKRLSIFALIATIVLVTLGSLFRIILIPLALSLFFAYLLTPSVNVLERRKWNRSAASGFLIITFLSIIVGGTSLFIPEVFRQVRQLIALVPQAIFTIQTRWIPAVELKLRSFNFAKKTLEKLSIDQLGIFGQMSDAAGQALLGVWRSTPLFISGAVDIIIVPILTFFIISNANNFANLATVLIPADLKTPIQTLARRIDQTLRSVIKGQFTVAAILGLFYVIGLQLVGIDSALAIGFVAGVCRIVPYMDVVVGGILSLLVVLTNFQGAGQLLGVVSVFVVVQALDGMIVTPRIIGDRVGVHPLIVVASVIAFGDRFGFAGVLVAIPILAVAKVIFVSLLPNYFRSSAFDPQKRLS